MELRGLVEGRFLELGKIGFGAEMELTILWRGCWVHLPEIGSLGYSGFGIRLCEVRTGISIAWF